MYGQLRNRRLIAWEKATDFCLEFFNVHVNSLEHTDLPTLFPDADGQNAYVNSFVDWLKYDTSSVANDIKLGYREFWDDDNGIAVLKKSIYVGGVKVDCVGSTVCYTTIKAYFRVEPGASELVTIGKGLHRQERMDKEKEQSLARIRLCHAGDTPQCGLLNAQVQLNKGQQPEKSCSAFGLGPGNITIPGCGPDKSDLKHSEESFLSKFFRKFANTFASGWLGQTPGVAQIVRLVYN